MTMKYLPFKSPRELHSIKRFVRMQLKNVKILMRLAKVKANVNELELLCKTSRLHRRSIQTLGFAL